MRGLLLSDHERRQFDEPAEQLLRPRPRRHHGVPGGDGAGLGPDSYAIIREHLDVDDAGVVPDLRAARAGGRLQRADRGVGVQSPGRRGVQYPGGEPEAGPADARFLGRQELARDADRGECLVHAVDVGVVAVVSRCPPG